MPCLGSRWGEEYLRKFAPSSSPAGLDLFDNDGSYPGDRACTRPRIPAITALTDSQWVQWKRITELYRWCPRQGVYLDVPDWVLSERIEQGLPGL